MFKKNFLEFPIFARTSGIASLFGITKPLDVDISNASPLKFCC